MAVETADRTEGADAIIRVRDLVVGFGQKVIMRGLNLDVRRGEVLGFVGGSGQGKSVLTRTILGLALGPYVVGRLSDLWGSLRLAFMTATLSNLFAFALFVLASRTVARDEESKLARANAARA